MLVTTRGTSDGFSALERLAMATVETLPAGTTDQRDPLVQLNEYIGQLGENERQRQEIRSELDRRIEQLITEATKTLQPLVDEGQRLWDEIEAIATTHRDALTNGRETKTVKLPHGIVAWRLPSKPSVVIEDEEGLRKFLEELKRPEFFKREEVFTPDRPMMLEHQDFLKGLTGIKFPQPEKFYAKPNAARAEITSDTIKESLPKSADTKKKKTKPSAADTATTPANESSATSVTAKLRRTKPR
jgi:phage host-nuclease inhibitor protein Gam